MNNTATITHIAAGVRLDPPVIGFTVHQPAIFINAVHPVRIKPIIPFLVNTPAPAMSSQGKNAKYQYQVNGNNPASHCGPGRDTGI
jgi:hypothetical protein